MRIHCLTLVATLTLAGGALGEFNHPGLLHGQTDLDRMRAAVAKREGPIFEGFKVLEADEHSQQDYRRKGPFPEIGRAPTIRMGEAGTDATAAYHNALMWAITGEQAHADKSIGLIDAWVGSLERITGIDGILGAGLQGIKFANAAEILRHTDSGWPEASALRCERWFMEVWHPKIENYAPFANGNWSGAALQMKMSIAVYCNDRALFEETVRYCVDGECNSSITHLIPFPSGQSQESTRAQHYAQLGLGLLSNAAETAWNQGVDLYGWADNRILRGFEWTAQYGLGEDVPYQHYLDRTGKYGFGGKHKHYTKISPISRGHFRPLLEQPLHHYTGRRGIPAPFLSRAAAKIRPEGRSGDQVGLGTLTYWRTGFAARKPTRPPGVPAGLVARTTKDGIRLTWPRSVDPVSCADAESYTVKRSGGLRGGTFETIATGVKAPHFEDVTAERGQLYRYVISSSNAAGESGGSQPLSVSAGLPGIWTSADIGAVRVPGFSEYDGKRFSIVGEGKRIGGRADSFHFTYATMEGDGTITARVVHPMSSQWSMPGVVMRESLDPGSAHASALLLPPEWQGALVTRNETDGDTKIAGETPLPTSHLEKKNRLMKPYWVRLTRAGNTFAGSMSGDGESWEELATAEVEMGKTVYVGMPACSQLERVSTTVSYDRVRIPGWRLGN